jgi:hypothetical protein
MYFTRALRRGENEAVLAVMSTSSKKGTFLQRKGVFSLDLSFNG